MKETIWMQARCPLCGGTFLHAVGCTNRGKSFVELREVDSTYLADPDFLSELKWQAEMRIGTVTIPLGG